MNAKHDELDATVAVDRRDHVPLTERLSARLTALLGAVVVAAVAFGSIAGAASWALRPDVDPDGRSAST